MRFEESKYFEVLDHHKIEMSFGNYYCCEDFFIAEINEGVHYDWEKVKKGAEQLMSYYGKNTKMGYISNRVNSYSIDPQAWIQVEEVYDNVTASGIVVHNYHTQVNAELEKRFSKKPFKQFSNIEETIDWVLTFKKD